MLVPFLSAAGGLVLVWVVYRLLKPGRARTEAGSRTKEAAGFRQAILLIVAADFMMSLDNVIAVAGSAHGSIFLLVAGLLISMPLLMTAGGLISALIDKARWLVYVGAAAISFTAARMVFEDKAVDARFHTSQGPGLWRLGRRRDPDTGRLHSDREAQVAKEMNFFIDLIDTGKITNEGRASFSLSAIHAYGQHPSPDTAGRPRQ